MPRPRPWRCGDGAGAGDDARGTRRSAGGRQLEIGEARVVGKLERVEQLLALEQALQDALAESVELGCARVAEQPQVEDPQRERVLAAPGELGARRVEGGRGSAAEQVRRGGQFGWREVLDTLPAGMPVSGALPVHALDEVIAGDQV